MALLSLLAICSCVETESIADRIDLEKWNESTVDFALNECGLKRAEYGSALISEEGDTVDFYYDISHILQKRERLIEIMKTNEIFSGVDNLKLKEQYYYTRENISFYFKKGNKYYSGLFRNGEYKITQQQGLGEEIFSLVNDSICMADIKIRIANIGIASELDISDNHVNYKTLSLYIDSNFQ